MIWPLVEKVYVVWAPTTDTKRFRLPIYVFCVVTVALYTVVAILLFIGEPLRLIFNLLRHSNV